MRLVLDTNVALSALLWRGTPFHLLTAIARLPQVQLYSSAALLEELTDVLNRSSAATRLALIQRAAHEILADYVAAVELVQPATVPRVVINDPDDDQVIATALAASADLIVTGDRKHLLPLRSWQGIQIVNAATALEQLTALT